VAHEPARAPRTAPPSGLRTMAVQRALDALTEQRRADLARPLRVLDLGGGTGGTAVPLAEAGHELTVVDPSPDALFSLRRRAAERGVEDRILALQGDTDTVGGLVGRHADFDLVCLHGTLEVVDDPGAALGAVAALLAGDGTLSLVVAQRLHGVLTRALAGEFEQARAILERPDGRWGEDDPSPRRFDEDTVVGLLRDHGLVPVQVHGIRAFIDLVPSALVDSDADRTALLALEDAASGDPAHPLLGALGSALHVLATRG
jgi:S-adenosylmethionine-dependent methyltransferase